MPKMTKKEVFLTDDQIEFVKGLSATLAEGIRRCIDEAKEKRESEKNK